MNCTGLNSRWKKAVFPAQAPGNTWLLASNIESFPTHELGIISDCGVTYLFALLLCVDTECFGYVFIILYVIHRWESYSPHFSLIFVVFFLRKDQLLSLTVPLILGWKMVLGNSLLSRRHICLPVSMCCRVVLSHSSQKMSSLCCKRKSPSNNWSQLWEVLSCKPKQWEQIQIKINTASMFYSNSY